MVALRCTRKLLTRVHQPIQASPPAPTTRLGDWYANLLFTRPANLVLCVSERSLLPVVVPARELDTLVPRFRRACGEVLRALGIPESDVQSEEREMAGVIFARTASKQVLGSMNDFVHLMRVADRPWESELELVLWLAKTPCGPLGMDSPREATVKLFASRLS